MINEHFRKMTQNKNVIRELSEFASARGEEIGYENVFDFTLGNPSVPAPDEYNSAVIDLHKTSDSRSLHGYTPTLGNPDVDSSIAASLEKRFGIPYGPQHIFMTSGAAGAFAHAVRAVTVPGETVLTFAPFFPEYMPYVNESGAELKVVPADTEGFQINVSAFIDMFDENVGAVLINSPNNPSGVILSEDTLKRLASIMEEKQREYGKDIYLISDEPYREIVFDGKECPYPASYYKNTLTCYSYSKSMSLPGERIGYVAVHPEAAGADVLVPMFGQISRGLGHNCPTSSVQQAVSRIPDLTSDLSVYETNMNLLYDMLKDLEIPVVRPGGTFYIFPKAPEEDAVAFCRRALKYDIILVPSDGFGVKGYFRMAYCIDTDKVKRSLPVFREFINKEYRGK